MMLPALSTVTRAAVARRAQLAVARDRVESPARIAMPSNRPVLAATIRTRVPSLPASTVAPMSEITMLPAPSSVLSLPRRPPVWL